MMEKIISEIKEHNKAMEDLLSIEMVEKIQKASDLIVGCYKTGGRVLLAGNGGSAADAQHIAAELVGKFKMERQSLEAVALSTNPSIVTALGNDYGFDRLFERQVEGMAKDKDVFIGISTSGNSENILRAVLKAKEKGAKTIGFTGRGGGKLKEAVDVLLNVPSDNTQRIQEAHIMIGHIICGRVEEEMFGYE